MNKRIREIAEQVGFGWDDKYHWYVGSRQMEKFAELIVKECSNFLKDTLDDHFAAEQLEEHFGVE